MQRILWSLRPCYWLDPDIQSLPETTRSQCGKELPPAAQRHLYKTVNWAQTRLIKRQHKAWYEGGLARFLAWSSDVASLADRSVAGRKHDDPTAEYDRTYSSKRSPNQAYMAQRGHKPYRTGDKRNVPLQGYAIASRSNRSRRGQ